MLSGSSPCCSAITCITALAGELGHTSQPETIIGGSRLNLRRLRGKLGWEPINELSFRGGSHDATTDVLGRDGGGGCCDGAQTGGCGALAIGRSSQLALSGPARRGARQAVQGAGRQRGDP